MSEQKKPQAGEYWRDYDDEILYVVGRTPSGEVVCVDDKNTTYVFDELDSYNHWTHLPYCTGWDWEPSEQWPKYYETHDRSRFAFARLDEGKPLLLVKYDGSEVPQSMYATTAGRVQLTEAEAKSRLKPLESLSTCPDCGELRGHGHEDVCPMAWVTQDLIPPRAGIDSVSWSTWPVHDWRVAEGEWEKKHGEGIPGITLNVRCRRKDLPPIPETTVEVPHLDRPEGPLQPNQTTVVLIGRRSGEVRWIEPDESRSVHDVEIKYDGAQFYVEES